MYIYICIEAAAAAADPTSMEFVFYMEMIAHGVQIAHRIFWGVSERKLVCGSARAAANVPGNP